MRHFDGNTLRGLKTATLKLINAFGKQEVAASETRVSDASLSNYCNPNQECSFIPLDVAADLMKASNDHSLLEYFAGMFGKKVVDDVRGQADLIPIEKSMNAIKEMSEASAALADAAADGNIDPDEAKTCLQEITEAEQALADVRETLKDISTK